jgi:hypothetical protein
VTVRVMRSMARRPALASLLRAAVLVGFFVSADQLALREDVPLHRAEQLWPRDAGGVDHDVERIHLEEVAMPADRRVGSVPRAIAVVVRARHCTLRQFACVERRDRGWDAGHDPVCERARWYFGIERVGILDDDREALRALGRATPR